MIDADKLRAQIVEIATGFDGACGCAPYREFMAEALGFPIDWRPFRVVGGKVEGVSTCYIFALNVLRRAGVAIHNWHVGEPIGTMIAWAKRNECWQEPCDGCCPAAGDVIVIGRESSPHVAVVVDCDGATLTSIDGGQVCTRANAGHDGTGRQAILRRSRTWGDNGMVVGSRTDQVIGWVDAARMPLR